MRTVYLCGHTGSENRGCEAIVRATTALLREAGQGDVRLMTFAAEQDSALDIERIPYPRKTLLQRAASWFMREVMGDGVYGQRVLHARLLRQLRPGDLIFNIGGDTYCYGTPYISYALNQQAQAAGVATVFWGCSVDERAEQDAAMRQDLQRYTHIVAREQLSFDRLCACVDPEKVQLACDPAFLLESHSAPLPPGFLPGNTVGINLSPLVMAEEAVRCLITQILQETDMHICLIPHVYVQDLPILRRIFEAYKHSGRVCLVEERLDCCQLKYIISQCRFMIGARTHAMIAAYSSMVPGLALSYSDKSIGIARDLFSCEDYVLRPQEWEQPETLWRRFVLLQKREAVLRAHYRQILPAYCESIRTALRKILQT